MTKSEQTRLMHWRLKIILHWEEGGNASQTCRHFGISRQSFYKWKRRYDEQGPEGLPRLGP